MSLPRMPKGKWEPSIDAMLAFRPLVEPIGFESGDTSLELSSSKFHLHP